MKPAGNPRAAASLRLFQHMRIGQRRCSVGLGELKVLLENKRNEAFGLAWFLH